MREKQRLNDLKKQGLLPDEPAKPQKSRGNKDRAPPKAKAAAKPLVVHNKKKK
jgi:hypothetical protein